MEDPHSSTKNQALDPIPAATNNPELSSTPKSTTTPETSTTCLICYNDFPSNEVQTTLSCEHKFCLNCFQEHIEAKMQAFQVLNIHCPQEGCEQIFGDNDIRKILDEEKYARYQDLVLKKMAAKKPVGRICPQPGCARPLPNLDIADEEIICVCGTHICPKCLNVSHPEKTCLQVLDPEFELFAQDNNIRFCIMCKTAVSRVEGCLHMTCCVCDYEWCWTCGRQYDPKHICSGTWNPSAPSIYQKKTSLGKAGDYVKKTLVCLVRIILSILFAPFFLLATLICWPFPLFLPRGRVRDRRRLTPGRMICYGLLSGLIGLVLLPITVFVGFIFVICTLPSFIARLRRRRRQLQRQKKQPKRWMLGNVEGFKYTTASRPEGAPPAEPNPPAILDEITEEVAELAQFYGIRRSRSLTAPPQPLGDLENPRPDLNQSAIQLGAVKDIEVVQSRKRIDEVGKWKKVLTLEVVGSVNKLDKSEQKLDKNNVSAVESNREIICLNDLMGDDGNNMMQEDGKIEIMIEAEKRDESGDLFEV